MCQKRLQCVPPFHARAHEMKSILQLLRASSRALDLAVLPCH